MPRTPRLDYAGARHHVMNRCARRVSSFEAPGANELFLEILGELPSRFAVQVHGYALMPNHYHLLMSTARGNLSRAMRHLGATFTQRLNAQNGWDGPVFRGRFRNRLVGDGRYWMHLLAYVHLNPVPGLVEQPEDWPWSSHRAYMGLDETPEWLTTADYIQAFGSRRLALTYIEEHRQGRGTYPDGWSEKDLWTPANTQIVTGASPEGLDPFPPGRALEEVVAVTGTPLEELVLNRRGRHDNRARWVAAWWLGRRSELTHRLVARYLGCRSGSVANMLFRMRDLTEGEQPDAQVQGWIATLEKKMR